MNKTVDIMMQLLKSAITGQNLQLSTLSGKQAKELYNLAKKHKMSPLFCLAATRNNLIDNNSVSGVFSREIYTAAVRNEVLADEYNKICQVFEKEEIPYIPLKGSVIRNFYPQDWMRSSRDIDILVKPEDHQRACEAVYNSLKYIQIKDCAYATTINTPQGICFELHFALLANGVFPEATEYLNKVWETAISDNGYRFKMDDLTFYYYHIVHMAKHFLSGCCGIRPIVDLWLLKRNITCDQNELNKLLKKSGLLKFSQIVESLSEIWFGEKEHTEETQKIEDYIISGGIEGDPEMDIAQSVRRHKGKFIYMLSRVFMPFNTLKRLYKILEKYPILAPFCLMHRVFSLLFGKKKERRKDMIEGLRGVSRDSIDNISAALDIVGFKSK